ncbi:VOC family protein [Robertkochia flava]|uniref:VOC family protein n=1 Tax=Robertkochia flava TaxID=3447986 RepID=UPI001CCB63C1|nr:VOC family protein [Robertkochia marina]
MKNILFLFLLLIPLPGLAQEKKSHLNHVTLVVSNLEESKAFYIGILQLEAIETPWWGEDDPYMFLSLGDAGELHIGEIEGIEIAPNGYNHFAIAVEDLDAFLSYLKAKGVQYGGLGADGEPWLVQTRPDGVRQTFLQDPDGYWVELNDKY